MPSGIGASEDDAAAAAVASAGDAAAAAVASAGDGATMDISSEAAVTVCGTEVSSDDDAAAAAAVAAGNCGSTSLNFTFFSRAASCAHT